MFHIAWEIARWPLGALFVVGIVFNLYMIVRTLDDM